MEFIYWSTMVLREKRNRKKMSRQKIVTKLANYYHSKSGSGSDQDCSWNELEEPCIRGLWSDMIEQRGSTFVRRADFGRSFPFSRLIARSHPQLAVRITASRKCARAVECGIAFKRRESTDLTLQWRDDNPVCRFCAQRRNFATGIIIGIIYRSLRPRPK